MFLHAWDILLACARTQYTRIRTCVNRKKQNTAKDMEFDIYQFILCVFVFVLLTALFTFLVVVLVKYSLRLTNAGLNDESIKIEYEKTKDKKPSVIGKIFDKVLLFVCCVALFASFAMSISVSLSCNGNKVKAGLPAVNVVRSGSMSYVSPNHKYIKEGQVTNQLQRFDVVFITEVPKEADLKVNDIVVYEFRGDFIIHRIVAIEEPNEKHPNERYFLLQGDANDIPDRFPVKYEQIKGIYTGTRIPFIGSFVLFMQSPAGWLCILLVIFAMIATPIAEKKLEQARKARIAILYPNSEVAIADDEETSPFAHLNGLRDDRTFREKLNASSEIVKQRYNAIADILCRIVGVRIIESKKSESYKKGNLSIAKLNIKGKTLNAYIALNPQDYENTKYVFEDASSVKAYLNYPMRLKLTSERQTRWAIELIEKFCAEKGLEISKVNPFKQFAQKREERTFDERISELPVVKARFDEICAFIGRIERARVIEGKKAKTFKAGNAPMVRFTIRGKTLNAFLALNPYEYEYSKYIYTHSVGKAYAYYPMRVKLTSERQTKWVIELLEELVAKKGLTLMQVNRFAHLVGKKDNRTFDEKLAILPIAKARFERIFDIASTIDNARIIEGKKSKTIKVGNTPIVKFTVRGKTLNAFIGLNPAEYENTKYIYSDVSSVKAYANYPMRVKVSSDRQVRWVIELIKELAKAHDFCFVTKLVPAMMIDDGQAVKEFSFASLKKKKSKSFKQRLKLSPLAKERYIAISKELEKIEGVRPIEGKKQVTYKLKNKPIIKLNIKGKTLNAYIGLNPQEFENSKYIFTDASSIKAYANYPMRVKVTSNRQVKWVIELINKAVFGGEV